MNDLELSAPHISPLEATQIVDELSAKVKNQTQDSNSEAELRRNIDEERQGKPDYNRMSIGLADATKHSLAGLRRQMINFGAIKSISFRSVSPTGADVYDVTFEKGEALWHIVVGPDGKTENIGFQMISQIP